MAATTQPITIASTSRSHSIEANWSMQSPCSGSASSVSIHPAPLFASGSVGSVGGHGASFGSRFYPGCSPGQLLNPLDPNDFKHCRVSSSIESDHGSLIRALSGDISQREDELCRNYSCCGLPLTDLHALVEHFEESHVVVLDASGGPHSLVPNVSSVPPSCSDSSLAGALGSPVQPNSSHKTHTRNSLSLSMTGGVAAFDPDDMELDIDSPPSSSSSTYPSPEALGMPLPQQRINGGSMSSMSTFSSPPDTPLLPTPISPSNSGAFGAGVSWGFDATGTIHIPTGPAAFDTTAVHLPKSPRGFPSHGSHSLAAHPYAQQHKKHSLIKLSSLSSYPTASAHSLTSALNGYSGYSDYSSALPGAIGAGLSNGIMMNDKLAALGESSVTPALLHGSVSGSTVAPSEFSTPMTTPAQSRAPSPTTTVASSTPAEAKEASTSRGGKSSAAPASPSTTLSRPGASLLLNKPFKCPKPGCMKSYKQANGLKYHMTHGQCNFNPPAELASVEGLSEREAERKLRPFCCQVPPCQRRYKNMNGLRYHYQHSGDHGAIGLALLASGNHDATKSQPSPPSISLDTNVAPDSPTTTAPRTSIPSSATQPLTTTPHAAYASAPTTPAQSHAPHLPQFSHMQQLKGMQTQSQPASAYATPWATPRSGSPYGQAPAALPQLSQQQMGYGMAQWSQDSYMS